jgi:hypothetical protein
MRPVWLELSVVMGLLVAGCGSPPPSEELRNQSLVLTKYVPSADFAAFHSFFLRPEIRTLGEDGMVDTIDPDKAQPLLDATEKNLIERGYQPVAKEDAELAVELDYLAVVSSATWCYSWWDTGYWGTPGSGYYPFYGCGTDIWRSDMLVTHVVDVSEAHSNPDGGDAGASGSPTNVTAIWLSGVYGVGLDSREAQQGIDQAFAQSPYLKSASPK